MASQESPPRPFRTVCLKVQGPAGLSEMAWAISEWVNHPVNLYVFFQRDRPRAQDRIADVPAYRIGSAGDHSYASDVDGEAN